MLTSNVVALMNLVAPEMFFKRGCMGPAAVSTECGWRGGRWHARSVDGEGAGGTHGVWMERGPVARTECGWRGGRWHARSLERGANANSKHWFTTSFLWREVPESDARSVELTLMATCWEEARMRGSGVRLWVGWIGGWVGGGDINRDEMSPLPL